MRRKLGVIESWNGLKVCVTGGAGLVGSHLVEQLVDLGADVTVADNLSRGSLENLSKVKGKIKFFQTDMRKFENCVPTMVGRDVVFNLAAKVAGLQYNAIHEFEMCGDTTILQVVPLQAAVEAGVSRFCQISTACVYPHDAPVPTPEEWGSKGDPEPTNRGYGWAKRIGERMAEYAHEEGMIECSIVRPFNAYGLRDYYDEETSHVIPALIKKAIAIKLGKSAQPLVVWGSGRQTRVFTHTIDFARGIRMATEKLADGKPCNVGDDNVITINSLAELICLIVGIECEIQNDSAMPEGYPERAADPTRLKTTGWVPTVKLEDGIREMVEWCESHDGKF